eukprot:922411-Pyramimonas_sp.AAC.1
MSQKAGGLAKLLRRPSHPHFPPGSPPSIEETKHRFTRRVMMFQPTSSLDHQKCARAPGTCRILRVFTCRYSFDT